MPKRYQLSSALKKIMTIHAVFVEKPGDLALIIHEEGAILACPLILLRIFESPKISKYFCGFEKAH